MEKKYQNTSMNSAVFGVNSIKGNMPAIGIDLGTTNSRVGVWQQGQVKIIGTDRDNRATPSYVAFTDTNRRLVGDAAKDQVAINPCSTVFQVKRLIGRRFNDKEIQNDIKHWPFKVINVGGKPKIEVLMCNERKKFCPEVINSMVLKKLKEMAEAYLKKQVRDAVIAVPAYFNDSQRQATKDAGTIAGLNVMRIINEPTATALAYEKNLKAGKHILIYDLGGGGLSVSVLSTNKRSVLVEAIGGDANVGGKDFDSRLVDHLCQEFKSKYKLYVESSPRALMRLRVAAEQAKCTLSYDKEALIEIDELFFGIDFNAKVSRTQFEELCADLFRSTLETVEKVLTDAKIVKESIHDVVLIGGSTRIPKIRSIVQSYFLGKQLHVSMSTDKSVVYGAAVQAAALTSERDAVNSILQDVVLLDVTPLSLGIETANGIVTKFIMRNTPLLECRHTKTFTTNFDNQSVITIQVYEGERAMSKDNNYLGRFELSGIAPAPRGTVRLEVGFEIDLDGILHVTAKNMKDEKNLIRVVSQKGRLSREEVNMLANLERYYWLYHYDSPDDRQDNVVSIRNEIENYVCSVKQAIEDDVDKLTPIEQDKAFSLCSKAIRSILVDEDMYRRELINLQNECRPIMRKIQAGDRRNGTNIKQEKQDEDEQENVPSNKRGRFT